MVDVTIEYKTVWRGHGMSVSPRDPNLDAVDWQGLRAQSHRMVDDMIDYVAGIRDRPVWQPMNPAGRGVCHADLPQDPTDLSQVYQDFQNYVLPYAVGNVHPGFMGWVHGGGTAVGMLAEMLAAGVNANLGRGDHIPNRAEPQVIE